MRILHRSCVTPSTPDVYQSKRSSQFSNFKVLLLCCATALAVAGSTATPTRAQDANSAAATKTLQEAAKQSYPLSTSTNVKGNVSIEAALIPPKISNKVFGKTVGNNYAAIEVIISNRSSDASLIVHTIFIDYHRWLLSGYGPVANDAECAQSSTGASAIDASLTDKAKTSAAAQDQSDLHDWQSRTCPNQISSVESRVVRGQLLDEQPWTERNWIIRALQAAGSIATGYTFTLSGTHAIQSIGAYNGIVVPAAQTFWPDATIGQMNRISDFGFQVNKVIARQSSEIVVGFFPLDRFLTPGLKKLFISSPASFFSPYAAILDPKTQKEFLKLLEPVIPKDQQKGLLSLANLNSIEKGSCKNPNDPDFNSPQCVTARVMARVSLNTVRVIVGGTMTVDVDSVPAKIDSIEFTVPAGQTAASMWTIKQDIAGVIHGSFLASGKPSIANADKLPISNLAAVAESSTDKELHFKMTLTDAVPPQTKLTFKVAKTTKDNVTVESAPFDYQTPAAPPAADKNPGTPPKSPSSNTSPTNDKAPKPTPPVAKEPAPKAASSPAPA